MELIAKTLAVAFDEAVAKYSNKVFLHFPDEEETYDWNEVNCRVTELAKGFIAAGVCHGDRVALMMPNGSQWAFTQIALLKVGAISVLINSNYKTLELSQLLKDSDAKMLIVPDKTKHMDYAEMAYTLFPSLSVSTMGELDDARYPHLRSVVCMSEDEYSGMLSKASLIAMGRTVTDSALAEATARVQPHDGSVMMYTSGTTGFSKGVCMTHFSVLNVTRSTADIMHIHDDDILFAPLPLFHIFGYVALCMTFVIGDSLVLAQSFQPVQALECIEKYRATALFAVPTIYVALTAHPDLSNYDCSSLKKGVAAGALCPKAVMEASHKLLGMEYLHQAYGLTEVTGPVTMTRREDQSPWKYESVGRPMHQMELKIMDINSDEELPRGKEGRIFIKGYGVMDGYYSKPEETAEVFYQDGWFDSGDLGTMDENGFIYFSGRTKELIVRGGENIYPKEIESFLVSFPDITDAQAVGIPSLLYGEEILVSVIPAQGAMLTEEDVIERIREALAFFKVPRFVEFTESFPLTGSGKVAKYRLKDDAVRQLREQGIEVPLRRQKVKQV
ncbi:MAG: AMP-binding protein [Oscillospiraceae bacterium]